MEHLKTYEGNSIQSKEAADFLAEYFHLVQWRDSEPKTILDVGCGIGDITWEILHPLLPSGTRIVGADLSSKRIELAAENYPNAEWITLDIGANKIPDHLKYKFDHIFSFNCLHWIENQRQVMKNLYTLLKPGGGILVYFVVNSPVYDAYVLVNKSEKWKQFVKHPEKYISPYNNDENISSTIKNILNEVGFNTVDCKPLTRQFCFPNRNLAKSFISELYQFYSGIPDNIIQSYIEDFTDALIKIMKNFNAKGDERIKCYYNSYFVYATKPI